MLRLTFPYNCAIICQMSMCLPSDRSASSTELASSKSHGFAGAMTATWRHVTCWCTVDLQLPPPVGWVESDEITTSTDITVGFSISHHLLYFSSLQQLGYSNFSYPVAAWTIYVVIWLAEWLQQVWDKFRSNPVTSYGNVEKICVEEWWDRHLDLSYQISCPFFLSQITNGICFALCCLLMIWERCNFQENEFEIVLILGNMPEACKAYM